MNNDLIRKLAIRMEDLRKNSRSGDYVPNKMKCLNIFQHLDSNSTRFNNSLLSYPYFLYHRQFNF
jgi:hypothetical protein